ncbi:hypothetical protein KKG41_00870 [Patescibacteria group bacterium]|nr:hypothetical protein [Patescibacteria group bacterium]MBU1891025.1 hypothetical protein [Patescibacteria group bacterium]
MFETSKDVLHLVSAGAIAIFAFFLCWIMYYFISILKTAKNTVNDIQEKINGIDEILKSVKEKVVNSSNYLALLTKSIMSLIDFFKERNDKKSSKLKK